MAKKDTARAQAEALEEGDEGAPNPEQVSVNEREAQNDTNNVTGKDRYRPIQKGKRG